MGRGGVPAGRMARRCARMSCENAPGALQSNHASWPGYAPLRSSTQVHPVGRTAGLNPDYRLSTGHRPFSAADRSTHVNPQTGAVPSCYSIGVLAIKHRPRRFADG